MTTDITAKIAEAEKQIERYENRRRELMQKHRAIERKERTKRLIERGAIAESLIDGAESMTNEQFKTVLERALRSDHSRRPSEPKQPVPAQDNDAESEDE